MSTDYDKQADRFLKKHGIKFACRPGTGKAPGWVTEDGGRGDYGNHYRITLSKPAARISFDFWGSVADRDAGIETVRPYSVLACVGADANCPATFPEFCREYGYDTDSMSANRTFKRCDRFARRLRAFFTAAELADLSEIN